MENDNVIHGPGSGALGAEALKAQYKNQQEQKRANGSAEGQPVAATLPPGVALQVLLKDSEQGKRIAVNLNLELIGNLETAGSVCAVVMEGIAAQIAKNEPDMSFDDVIADLSNSMQIAKEFHATQRDAVSQEIAAELVETEETPDIVDDQGNPVDGK